MVDVFCLGTMLLSLLSRDHLREGEIDSAIRFNFAHHMPMTNLNLLFLSLSLCNRQFKRIRVILYKIIAANSVNRFITKLQLQALKKTSDDLALESTCAFMIGSAIPLTFSTVPSVSIYI